MRALPGLRLAQNAVSTPITSSVEFKRILYGVITLNDRSHASYRWLTSPRTAKCVFSRFLHENLEKNLFFNSFFSLRLEMV